MSQPVRAPRRAALLVVGGMVAVALTAAFPGAAALVAIVLAILGVGGYRWRWASLAVCALLLMAVTAPLRVDVRDGGGSSMTSPGVDRR